MRYPLPKRHFFAVTDEGDGGGSTPVTEGDGKSDTKPEQRTFTQDEVQRSIQARVAREQHTAENKFADYGGSDAALARLKELEDANKTEADKQQEALETARREAEQAKRDAAAARIEADQIRKAGELGITGDYLGLVVGKPEDQFEGDANLVSELIAAKDELDQIKARGAVAGQGRVTTKVGKLGGTPVETNSEPTAEDRAREAAARLGLLKDEK